MINHGSVLRTWGGSDFMDLKLSSVRDFGVSRRDTNGDKGRLGMTVAQVGRSTSEDLGRNSFHRVQG